MVKIFAKISSLGLNFDLSKFHFFLNYDFLQKFLLLIIISIFMQFWTLAQVQELIRRIQQLTKSGVEQLFLLEVICSELCLHKGADINQMTQMSGNPDKDAQCNNHEMLKVPGYFITWLIRLIQGIPSIRKSLFMKIIQVFWEILRRSSIFRTPLWP